MTITATDVRAATEADAEAIVQIHHEAVQVTASPYYAPSIIESWAAKPTEQNVEKVRTEIADKAMVVVVAEVVSQVVGFGMIVPGDEELRAVYVHPEFGRRGVGAAILERLEEMALKRGASRLQLHSSINAEAFYALHGYKVVERTTHRLRSGHEMACVTMTKELNG